MDEDPNQLIEAPEDDDINYLNEETFGDFEQNYDADWETHHDHLAYVGFDIGYPNDDLDELELQETDLEHKLNQLVVDDDDDVEGDDDAERSMHSVPIKKKPVNLDELFGPQSPPRLFDSDGLIMGQPSIWGSPARESQLHGSGTELQGLLKTMLQKSSVSSDPRTNMSASIPGGARTLEEIEHELLQKSSESGVSSRPNGELSRMLTVKEIEKKLRGETDPDTPSSSVTHSTQPSTTPSTVLSGGTVPVARIPGLLPVVPGSMQRIAAVTTGNIPAVRKPADGKHISAAGPATQPLWTQMPPHVLSSANRMHSARDHRLPMPPSHGYPTVGLHYPPRVIRHPSDSGPYGQHRPGMPVSNEQAQFLQMMRSRRPTQPSVFPDMQRGPFTPLQQQQLYQQQMMQRHAGFHPALLAGDPVRAAALQRLHQVQQQQQRSSGRETQPPSDADEYSGLMTQREKDWVVKIQLLQLHTDNPYVDDYYYTCWSVKKMLKERQSREGIQSDSKDSEPTLVLPQLAKTETKAYSPTQFEGALGRLTASSIHNPRQIINVHIAPGAEADDTRGVVEVKRFKEFLLRIEKGYDCLLSIDDVEKKALAQPSENRQALYDERTQLISQLFHRLAAGPAVSDAGPEASSDEDGLVQIMSIRKGLLLIVRLMPLLNTNDSRTVTCLLLQRFATRKEWSSEMLPRVYTATERVIQAADLESLVQLSSALSSAEPVASADVPPDNNSGNHLAPVLQSKFGISMTLSLLNQAEHIYSTASVLDLDTEHQTFWQQFVSSVASTVELMTWDSTVVLLGKYPLVTSHFRRLLDKRSQLLVEDKLDTLLSPVSSAASPIT